MVIHVIMIQITITIIVEEARVGVGAHTVGQIRRLGWVSQDLTRILHAKGKHANIQMRSRPSFISSTTPPSHHFLPGSSLSPSWLRLAALPVLVDSCESH